nr:hypothetical transcript [Hymenolepis microstoma]
MHEEEYVEPDAKILSIRSFHSLLKEGKLVDTVVPSIDDEFPAHKIVLYVRFKAYEKCQIDWKRLPSKIVKSILGYAYTGILVLDTATALQIYKLAIDLGCFRMRRWCADFIIKWFHEFDVPQVWELAITVGNRALTKMCAESILNGVDIHNLENNFYQNLHYESLQCLIKEVKNVTDLDKLIMISEWMKPLGNNFSDESFLELLNGINWKKIDDVTIMKIMTDMSHISFNGAYKQLLYNVYKNVTENVGDSSSFSGSNGSCQQRPHMKYFIYGYNNDTHGGKIMALSPLVEEIDGEVPFRYFVTIITFKVFTSLEGGIERVAELQQKRSDHCATSNEENIFVFGGADTDTDTILDSCEIYDPNSDSWTLLPSMPTARRACAAINIPDVGILVVGGSKKISLDSEGLSICELLTKEGNGWKWENYTFMQHARVCARA